MTTVDLTPAGAARRAVNTKTLLACGAIAGPLFTVAWILEGRPASTTTRCAIRSAPWSWATSVDPAGQLRRRGRLTLAFAVGRRALRPLGGSTWGPLAGAHGIGLLGAGIFVTDLVSGYLPEPPTTW